MKSASQYIEKAGVVLTKMAERQEISSAIRSELQSTKECLDKARKRLVEIEGNFAIDFGNDLDERLEKARDKASRIPSGVVGGQQLEGLRDHSPILSHLYQCSIDIKKVTKFAEEEEALAKWIGERIEELSPMLAGFRKAKKDKENEGEWVAYMPLRKTAIQALVRLRKANVIAGKRVLLQTKDERWVPYRNKFLRDDDNAKLLVVFEKLSTNLFDFIRGRWLNAYTYFIINDQIRRQKLPYELYTEVAFTAPPDVMRVASDFDVLGRFKQTVVCVECKSGLLSAKRGHFDEIKQKTAQLQEVLKKMGDESLDFRFYLVFDPDINNAETVEKNLKGSSIMPLTPKDVRATMAQMVKESA